MPAVWSDSSVVRVHAHSERVLGSSPGRVIGAGKVNVKKKHMTRRGLEPRTFRRPRQYSDHLAIRPHYKSVNSTNARGRVVVLLPGLWSSSPFRKDVNTITD